MPESTPPEGKPLVGDVIAGRYRIDSVAGEGGMGIVYEAEHVILRQRVAVKVMRPGVLSSAEALERFALEASAIARMTSEHVVRVTDAGTLPNGAPYLVMEYLEGSDLETVLARQGALAPSHVVDFALQALEALTHAHAAHVIHRDLKPANLFLAQMPDGRQIIKLLDFGIAMAVDVTARGDRVLGSPRYMSPEQLRNAPLDPRTDLWSLGVVLYELLSGRRAFDGAALRDVLDAILQGGPRPLHETTAAISHELSMTVDRCLKRDPRERWSSTADLARALAPHGTGQWLGALDRIDAALAKATPARGPRRFDTLETALHALHATHPPRAGAAIETIEAVERSVISRGPVSRPEAFDATMSAGALALAMDDAPVSSRGSTLRIVLFDDSEPRLSAAVDLLGRARFDVRTTTSVRELDDLLESWNPHLVLMALEMRGIDVAELCLRVKAKYRATRPIALVSAVPPAELENVAKWSKADASFSRTSDWLGLVDFVRSICAMTCSPEDLPEE